MGANSKIGWTHHTWSPWHGCAKVSAGCANCYAADGAKRNPGVLGVWGPDGTRVISKSWDKPLRWNAAAATEEGGRRVFPSICDPFEDREDLVRPRADFLRLMRDTPHLTWLILTKRPECVVRLIRASLDAWPSLALTGRRRDPAYWWAADWINGCPPRNVWLGVTAEDQAEADRRIPILLSIPAVVRFVSAEPLLGPIDLTPWLEPVWTPDADPDAPGITCPAFDWIICGGESGPKRRPMELAWLESIVGQCRDAGVACYVKQDAALRDGQQGRIPDDLWSLKQFPEVA